MTTLAANWSLADALAEEEARFAAANPGRVSGRWPPPR